MVFGEHAAAADEHVFGCQYVVAELVVLVDVVGGFGVGKLGGVDDCAPVEVGGVEGLARPGGVGHFAVGDNSWARRLTRKESAAELWTRLPRTERRWSGARALYW